MMPFNFTRSLIFIAVLSFQFLPFGVLLFNSWEVSQWDDHAGWITDKKTNCKFYTSQNFQHRHIEWDGACNEGLAHGPGILTIYEGNQAIYRYDGDLVAGFIEGQGRLLSLSDGDVYEGNFSNGKMNGDGHFYNDDGDHFKGQYVDGMMSGFGTYWYEPDHPIFKYSGMWKNNRIDGPGKMVYRDGQVVTGRFKDGDLVASDEEHDRSITNIPKNILITNDDGVEDMDRLVCLAEEVSTFANQVVIVVSTQNRSGTSNNMSVTSQGYLHTRCLSVDTLKNISIYEVEGYPADCVLLAALGIFYEQGIEIDLVISGINGGPNDGASWFGSGTIGAARTAALGHIPAIAVSGIDEDSYDPENLKTICKWVGELARSEIVQHIKPLEYLTISIPENLQKIKGNRIVPRAITFDNPPFYLAKTTPSSPQPGESYTWQIAPLGSAVPYNRDGSHDVSYYMQDYIVIVPMTVDENNSTGLPAYKELEGSLPQITKK